MRNSKLKEGFTHIIEPSDEEDTKNLWSLDKRNQRSHSRMNMRTSFPYLMTRNTGLLASQGYEKKIA